MHNEYSASVLRLSTVVQTTNLDEMILENGLFFVCMSEILKALTDYSQRI